MSGSESARRSTADLTRVFPEVEVQHAAAGARRHAAQADHVVSLLTGAPVRISCLPSGARCTRTRGQIDVFPAGTSEQWFEDDASEVLAVTLPSALVRLAAEEMGLPAQRAELSARCQVRDPQLEHLAWALATEQREGSPNGLIYRQSVGMALAVHLLSRYRAPSAPSSLSRAELTRVTEYIEAHLNEDVSLLRLARVAGVSASHLRVLFKRALGCSMHQYVIQRRVERAKRLLLSGQLPASQIALEAGFSHQSHMARCMRRVLGVVPTALTARRRG
jgi:AraC family transcriptional regulator